MSGTSRRSIEVQDEKIGKMRRHAGLIIIMLNYYNSYNYVEFVSQLIKINDSQYMLHVL